MSVDPDAVRERILSVRARASAAGNAAVRVVAVTKGFDHAAVAAAVEGGADGIGESYAQEMVAKLGGRPPGIPVHYVGQLQTNKVRSVCALVDLFESVDRDSLAGEIARRRPGARVLVQVAAEAQAGKGGCAPADTGRLVERCRSLGLAVEGLMTVAPTGADHRASAATFRTVRALADRLGLTTCSMGMSDDFEIAVAEGATEVRLGSALFGPRP